MAKPKKTEQEPEPDPSETVVLYIECPSHIKTTMQALARKHNRKLTGEVIQAIQEYLERAGLWPHDAEGGAK